ncbi:hypothetical protein FHG87_020448 [Trinorchestia longiramus]|nr:hypothetical protein FHG87_020448 [Trinorchestia longiramus]
MRVLRGGSNQGPGTEELVGFLQYNTRHFVGLSSGLGLTNSPGAVRPPFPCTEEEEEDEEEDEDEEEEEEKEAQTLSAPSDWPAASELVSYCAPLMAAAASGRSEWRPTARHSWQQQQQQQRVAGVSGVLLRATHGSSSSSSSSEWQE